MDDSFTINLSRVNFKITAQLTVPVCCISISPSRSRARFFILLISIPLAPVSDVLNRYMWLIGNFTGEKWRGIVRNTAWFYLMHGAMR